MKFFVNLGSKKIGIILVSFIVVSVALGIFMYMNNPKIKFMKLINKEYQSFVNIVDRARESELATLSTGSTITSNGSVSFDLSLNNEMFGDSLDNIISIINDLSIDYQYGSDPKNNNTYVKLKTDIANKDFIDMELYQMNDKKYIYLNNIYDKYIESDSTAFIESQNGQVEDTLYLIEKTKTSLFNAIKESDFTMESKTIKINNQDINTNKMTLKLTDKRMKEITKSVLTDIKNDSKCIEILKELSESDADVKKSIDETIASLDDEKILEQDVLIDMYISNNKITRLDIINGSNKTFEYLNYESFYPITKITFFDKDNVALEATFEQKTVNDVSYKIILGNGDVVASGALSKIANNSIENKTWDLDLSFSLELSYNNMTLGSLKVDTKTITKIGEEIKMIDVTNVIKEEDITEEEQAKINEKLMEKVMEIFPVGFTDSEMPIEETY